MVETDKEKIDRGRSRLVENTVSLALAGFLSLVFTLVQLGILSRFMREGIFGAFIALRGFHVLLATLLLAGLPQVMIRFLPSYQQRNQGRKALFLFTGSAVVVLILGILLYATSALWKDWIPGNIRDELVGGRVISWMALASIALALKLLLYGAFKGLRVMRLQTILEVCYLGAFTLFVLLTRDSLRIQALFQAIFGLNLLVCMAGYPIFLAVSGRMIGGEGGAGRKDVILPSFFPYWGICLCLSLVALAFTDIDRFLMSSMLPVAVISVFHIASRINVLLKRFLGFPIIALQPEVTRVYEEGRWEELKGKVRLFTRGTFVVSVFFAAIVAVTGRDVITVISGPGYSEAYRVLLILLPTVPIAAFIAPLLVTMKGLHYVKWAMICDLTWMVVYFGSFPPLVSLWGIAGMAVAQLTGSAAQMAAAVLLARKEGFYGGLGPRFGRVFLLLAGIVPVGMIFTRFGGIPASAACLLVFPFLLRLGLGRSGLFDSDEKNQMIDLVRFPRARKVAGWFLMVKA